MTKKWHSMIRRRKIPKHIASFISNKIEELMKEGYPRKQAIAIAYSEARKKHPTLKKKLEPTHHEWEYYGGKVRGEPEPKDKYY